MIRNRINIKIEERETEYKKYEKVRRLTFFIIIFKALYYKERERERRENYIQYTV